jgi:hypothetical protein
LKIFAIRQSEVKDAAFIGVHCSKRKRQPAAPNLARRMKGHCAQLSFTRSTEAKNIADNAIPSGEIPTERLVQNMLHRFENFGPISLEQLGIAAIQIDGTSAFRLLEFNLEVEARFLEYRLEKLSCLFVGLVHPDFYHRLL